MFFAVIGIQDGSAGFPIHLANLVIANFKRVLDRHSINSLAGHFYLADSNTISTAA